MALTVADDLVLIDAGDVVGTWTAQNGASAAAENVDTPAIRVQGISSIECRVNGTGLSWMVWDNGGATLSKKNTHLVIWSSSFQSLDTVANGGARVRIATDAIGNVTWGEWNIGGSENFLGPVQTYHRWCVDTRKGFDAVSGTPPLVTAIGSVSLVSNFLTANGRISWRIDHLANVRAGSTGRGGIVVTGTLGDSNAIVNDATTGDIAIGRGLFKDVGGIYQILGRVTIGDITNAASSFSDVNKVWVYEDQQVAAYFHELELVGHVTPSNTADFGTEVGTGVAAVGVGGNTFTAANTTTGRPFRVTATDANITTRFFGCNFIGATSFDDSVNQVWGFSAGPVWTDNTVAANNAATTTFNVFRTATPANTDYFATGYEIPFQEIKVNTSTAGTNAYTVTWQYSTGTGGWSNLADVTDGTTNFKTTGLQTVTFAIPSDWATDTLNGEGPYYWVRALHDGGAETVRPIAQTVQCGTGGKVRLENANVKAISCLFSGMDVVSIRNGAILRKCTITDSVANIKSAALDLGSADPATDSVRDLQIQNSNKGILLKGTSAGTTTYNFRNIVFAGNTSDVRIDFPVGATININILEGGSTPTVDNVNGSTVNVNVSVTLEINSLTEGSYGVMIGNGGLEDGVQVLSGYANSLGKISGAFGGTTPQNVDVKARNGGIINAAILEDSGTGFTDFTLDARDFTGTNDGSFLPAVPAINDAFYYGGIATFEEVLLHVTVAGDTYVITWEYWDGTAWASLTVTDASNSFFNIGWYKVNFTAPTDWATTTVNAQGPFYYIRSRATTGGGTQPKFEILTLNKTKKYIPFVSTGTIAAGSGLTSTAVWIEDLVNK